MTTEFIYRGVEVKIFETIYGYRIEVAGDDLPQNRTTLPFAILYAKRKINEYLGAESVS